MTGSNFLARRAHGDGPRLGAKLPLRLGFALRILTKNPKLTTVGHLEARPGSVWLIARRSDPPCSSRKARASPEHHAGNRGTGLIAVSSRRGTQANHGRRRWSCAIPRRVFVSTRLQLEIRLRSALQMNQLRSREQQQLLEFCRLAQGLRTPRAAREVPFSDCVPSASQEALDLLRAQVRNHVSLLSRSRSSHNACRTRCSESPSSIATCLIVNPSPQYNRRNTLRQVTDDAKTIAMSASIWPGRPVKLPHLGFGYAGLPSRSHCRPARRAADAGHVGPRTRLGGAPAPASAGSRAHHPAIYGSEWPRPLASNLGPAPGVPVTPADAARRCDRARGRARSSPGRAELAAASSAIPCAFYLTTVLAPVRIGTSAPRSNSAEWPATRELAVAASRYSSGRAFRLRFLTSRRRSLSSARGVASVSPLD